MRPNGGDQTRLTDFPAECTSPSWLSLVHIPYRPLILFAAGIACLAVGWASWSEHGGK